MTRDELIDKLVELYTDPQIPVTAAGGIFAFSYGEYVVDIYRPAELMNAANAKDSRVKKRYEAELGSALNMYRYFKAHPEKFVCTAGANGSARNLRDDKLPRQLITYGAPGTGKSWSVKELTKGEDTIRTTFHPDSDYSTFVGSYKPSVEKDKFQTVVTAGERNAAGTLNKKDELFTQKRIVYKFVPQAFIKAYVDAWKYKAAANGGEATRKYLVIEEINRGNCAQIFGDLFQLLDRNDDGFSDYPVDADEDLRQFLAETFEKEITTVDARERVPPKVLSGEQLLLPENLYIWATMNTSDQSLFPIDSAFKRRWEWKYMPIYDAQKDYKIVVDGDEYKWWDFLEKANALVQEFTDSEDKKLGYFFCKAGPDNKIPLELFVGKVIFYLWNDVFKDVGFDHAAFDGGNGEKLLFKTFFNPDGSPKAETVKKLMENLGVSKVAETVA